MVILIRLPEDDFEAKEYEMSLLDILKMFKTSPDSIAILSYKKEKDEEAIVIRTNICVVLDTTLIKSTVSGNPLYRVEYNCSDDTVMFYPSLEGTKKILENLFYAIGLVDSVACDAFKRSFYG